MDLSMRYFVAEGKQPTLAASELHVSYSEELQEALSDEEFEEEMEMGGPDGDPEDLDWMLDQRPMPESQIHGYDFENMYNDDRDISMINQVIKEYYFDYQGHFIGLTLLDVVLGKYTKIVPSNLLIASSKEDHSDMVDSYGHTRLIGFRTTKPCQTNKFITSIQPIYYSVDDNICKNRLTMLSDGMKEEIPEYGLECSDPRVTIGVAQA